MATYDIEAGHQRVSESHLDFDRLGYPPQSGRLQHGASTPYSRSLSGKTDIDEATSDLTSVSGSRSEHTWSSDDEVSNATLASCCEDGFMVVDVNQHYTAKQYTFCNADTELDGYDQSFRCPTQSPSPLLKHPTRSLQDELFAALTPTAHKDGRDFFVQGHLAKILTEKRVRQVLAGHFEDSLTEENIAEYAKKICSKPETDDKGQIRAKSYIKFLAILIMSQTSRAIIKVLEDPEGVDDSDLPLIKIPRLNDENMYDLEVRKTKPHRSFKPKFQTKWNQNNIRTFEDYQWTTLPLLFAESVDSKCVSHQVLQERRILPFIRSHDQRHDLQHGYRLEGGFATVLQVAIHPEHHNFRRLTAQKNRHGAYFAVKSLHSENREAFEREVEMLNKFSSNKHAHLISLLATYEQSNRFFLLFDWAKAELQKYWTQVNPQPSFDMTTMLWMARQCKGIAHGLIKIHEHVTTRSNANASPAEHQNIVFGHHGDIKPENVLWFADTEGDVSEVAGTLKLSDFGLARFSVHQTISMTPTKNWAVSLAYRPPEADLKPDAAKGRSYDIWTLGCLYLEFVTWMLGGSELLREFSKARKAPDGMWYDIETQTFFVLKPDNGKRKAEIKPAVVQFIRKLHAHTKCSEFLHELLDMVQDGLLVVKKNDLEQMDRLRIEQIHQKFTRMVALSESDPTYAIGPAPRVYIINDESVSES